MCFPLLACFCFRFSLNNFSEIQKKDYAKKNYSYGSMVGVGEGDWFQYPIKYKNQQRLKSHMKQHSTPYWHTTYTHPPVYFKPSLDCLQCLLHTILFIWIQFSMWHLANLSFTFWNFLELFFPNITHLQLIVSIDAEPMNTKGWL